MENLRLGIVGSGFIAKFHVSALQSVRGVELTGLLKRNGADELASFAAKNRIGQPRVCSTINELAEVCDAIAIFVPNYAQLEALEQVCEAKKAGAPFRGVIMDKPLGRNVAEALRITALAKEAGLLTAYFENQIHMKAIKAQKQQLAPHSKRRWDH